MSVIPDGKVDADDAGLITGGDLYKETRTERDGFVTKTSYTAGENITALDRAVAKLQDAPAMQDTRNTVTGGTNVTVDEKKNTDGSSRYTVSVIPDGKVHADDAGLITGGDVYKETRTERDGFVTKADSTAGENISALDRKVQQNAGDITEVNQQVVNIGRSIRHLDRRINRAGAGAAALAALHPQDFNPDDKWDFSAGYGNYKGANAVAVGAFYRPSEDIMLSAGGSFSGGEHMVNAGISWKFGQTSGVGRSKIAMAKEILELKRDNLAMRCELDALTDRVNKGLPAVSRDVNFPDVPKNHWAYSYVKSLADRGYLEGYPDGEFKGDRTMTRYEYAAIIYRALENGAPLDGNMAQSVAEFKKELKQVEEAARFRIDRIRGADNDRYKAERVRVNDESRDGKLFDVYGSLIDGETKK